MQRIGALELGKLLGISKPAVYRRLELGLLPPPIEWRPLEWDADSPSYKSWYELHPSSPQGRKLYASASEFAKAIGISRQGMSQRMHHGSVPPWDFEIMNERLWLWSLLHPFINRLEASKNGWAEPAPALGSRTPMPYVGEACVGRRGQAAAERKCRRQAVCFVLSKKVAIPVCGICAGRNTKTQRQVSDSLYPNYGGIIAPDPDPVFVAD